MNFLPRQGLICMVRGKMNSSYQRKSMDCTHEFVQLLDSSPDSSASESNISMSSATAILQVTKASKAIANWYSMYCTVQMSWGETILRTHLLDYPINMHPAREFMCSNRV